ncbi:MAG: gliding motility lipoprotein GldH [Flavobacteriales bacterium]|nr:gliding motility lipoprotein GldH [Flavobacteriales bacterium]
MSTGQYLFRIVGLFICIGIIGCDSNRVYENNIEIAEGIWNKDSTLIFQIDIQDTIVEHNLSINIRNQGGYAYSNLFLFVKAISPLGSMIKDTVEITLAEKNGKWKGEGIGNIFHLRQLYRQAIRFPYAGLYTFEVQHAMREDNLEEIVDIGFRLEKINE